MTFQPLNVEKPRKRSDNRSQTGARTRPEVLPIEKLPVPRFYMQGEWAIQIAAYLRRLLQNQSGKPQRTDGLWLPNILSLSGHLHHSVQQVFDGLEELRRQGYTVTLNGLDQPIQLEDPLHRTHHNQARWHALSDEMLRPHDVVRRHTRNPLDLKVYMRPV